MSALLTPAQAREAVEIGMSRGARIVHQVLNEVARHSGVSRNLILSKRRALPLARARGLVIRAAYQNGASVQEIARVLRRDRTTILHALGNGAAAGRGRSRAQPQCSGTGGGGDA